MNQTERALSGALDEPDRLKLAFFHGLQASVEAPSALVMERGRRALEAVEAEQVKDRLASCHRAGG